MPPPDYWPDARRIPKKSLRPFVETVRAVRKSMGFSNVALCREVHALIQAHNEVPGREPVHLKAIAGDWEYGEQGKYELGAIIKGTRKYIVGYLAWLCLRDGDAAKKFYKEIELPYRAFPAHEAPGADAKEYSSWSALIDAYAELSRVEVISLAGSALSLVDLADREPVAKALRLEEPFCFRFDAPIAGDVLAFQRHRGKWYPLPLAESALHLRIAAGPQILPRDEKTGTPPELSENEETGRYGFGILIADDERVAALSAQLKPGEILPEQMVGLAARIMDDLPEERRAIYRINVTITE